MNKNILYKIASAFLSLNIDDKELNKIHTIFDHLDKDKDGYLSYDEFKNGIEK